MSRLLSERMIRCNLIKAMERPEALTYLNALPATKRLDVRRAARVRFAEAFKAKKQEMESR